jgi:hypothetical protein
VKPARIVRDGGRIAYGDVTLTARLTPGAHPGHDDLDRPGDGRREDLQRGLADGTTVSGTRLAGSRRIRDRGRLPADLRCAGGAEARRLAHRAPSSSASRPSGQGADRGRPGLVDPKGYASWVAAARQKFEAQLAADRAAAAKK